MLKTLGYLISSVSVLCLAIVSWDGAKEKPVLLFLLIVGAATSVIGMMVRWLSFAREQQAKGKKPGELEGPPREAARGAGSRR